ncbi:MAG: tetratricopeptide repeat protein, partial [Xenococcus sp. (in: cyanobacteria)]
MSQDGSAGRDLVQVGRDYIRHINVNIASGNWLTAGVSLLPAIVALGLAGTGVKFAVDRSLIPLPQPEIHNNNNMYFTNLAVIEKEYKEKKGQPLQDQDLRRKIERAIDLAKEKNYQESIFLFEEIARIVQLPSIYNNLGVVYAGNENYTDAQEAYKKALELNPDFKDIYLNLGLLAEAQRKLKEAEDYYQNAPNSKKVKTRSKNIQSELKKKVHKQELEPNENIFYATPIARDTTVLG